MVLQQNGCLMIAPWFGRNNILHGSPTAWHSHCRRMRRSSLLFSEQMLFERSKTGIPSVHVKNVKYYMYFNLNKKYRIAYATGEKYIEFRGMSQYHADRLQHGDFCAFVGCGVGICLWPYQFTSRDEYKSVPLEGSGMDALLEKEKFYDKCEENNERMVAFMVAFL